MQSDPHVTFLHYRFLFPVPALALALAPAPASACASAIALASHVGSATALSAHVDTGKSAAMDDENFDLYGVSLVPSFLCLVLSISCTARGWVSSNHMALLLDPNSHSLSNIEELFQRRVNSCALENGQVHRGSWRLLGAFYSTKCRAFALTRRCFAGRPLRRETADRRGASCRGSIK